jgi:ATP-binding cassette subfamily B protein/subfamily B ATP-binding cassette protein MsbA
MTFSLRRQVFASLRPYRNLFAFALFQVVLIGAAELLKPWPLKLIIDNVLGGQPLFWPPLADWSRETLLLAACAGLVGIYIVLGGLHLLNNYTTIRIGQSMVNDLRGTLYNHLQRLSLAFHSRRQIGDLLYRVTADTYAIQTLTMNGVFPILTSLVLLAGMTLVMLRLDWVLTLLALGVCPLLFLTISAMSSRINAAATAAHERESTIYSLVQRTMAAIRVIQAFTKEEEEHRRFMAASTDSLKANLRLYNLQTLYSGVINVVIAVGTALVVWVGARHVLTGTLSIGDLVVFTSYLASLYGPINTISQTLGMIEGARAGLARVQEILTVERDLPEGKRVAADTRIRGEVVFENVAFGYMPGQAVLRGVNLHVAPGQTVAIVGPSGAGKSTLVSLLPRFYDPQAGQVLLDGTNVHEFTLASLRQQIAMVLQPPLVFPITVRENIAYGRSGAPPEAVEQAARLARIHETIMRLPQGYDTVVGEQGATLSEGERQRLTIARAILRDAPILILDEPTSSVDAETEALIMAGLERLMAGRTTFIIAHRLSTVRRADVILVIRGGQIVEQGSFAELMRRQGPFAALYHTQFSAQEELQRAVS